MIRGLAVMTLVLGIALAGCGGDDSGETTTAPPPSIPAITSPLPAPTTTAPATTTTPTGSTTTGKGNGGTGAPGRANPNEPDSATNDVPPPAGSPQERFEKQCEQNPASCG